MVLAMGTAARAERGSDALVVTASNRFGAPAATSAQTTAVS